MEHVSASAVTWRPVNGRGPFRHMVGVLYERREEVGGLGGLVDSLDDYGTRLIRVRFAGIRARAGDSDPACCRPGARALLSA